MKHFPLIPLFFAVAFFGCSPDPHPPELERVETLVPHLMPVRSIDPEDTVFSDLEPLRTTFSGATIVLLGEQSHGDGATFLAKARLIQFLHQRMGFDVLAMESGLFECELAGDLIASGFPADTAIALSTFDVWTASRQFQPTIDYIQRTHRTERPLRFTGFDLQLTGAFGRDSASTFFQRYLSRIPSIDSSDQFTIALYDTLTRHPKKFSALPDSIHERFYSGLRILRTKIEQAAIGDHLFWMQEAKSKEMFARFLWNVDWNKPDPAVMNLRDQQMGENLLWLSRVRYPGRKIIVWAASSHIARNRSSITGRSNDDTLMIPLGHHVWKAMKDSIYALGFTAYDGTMGLRHRNRTVLAQSAPGTLEDILSHTGHTASILNFRTLPADHWLRDTVKARPFGYSVMNARWPEMLDGMMYIKTMTPSEGKEEP